MPVDSFQAVSSQILEEVSRALASVEERQMALLEDAILAADRVFLAGAGRSGLVGRCFAMRLGHLGVPAQVVGDTTTPPVRPGDLLIAVSCSGETDTVCSLAKRAVALGARVAAVTATADSSLARAAGLAVIVPSGPSQQYRGNLFEQAVVVLLAALAIRLQQRLGQTWGQMDARHANLE